MKNRNIFRRLKAFCLISLSILIILSVLPVYAVGDTEIIFGEVKVEAGDEAVIPVNIKNNPGFSTFRFRVSYDMSNLEFISIEKGTILNDGTVMSVVDEEKQTITFTWLSVTDSKGDGEIAILRFKTSDNALGDYLLKVTYLSEDLLNQEMEPITYTVTNGKITVVEKTVPVTGITIEKLISVNIGGKKTPKYTVQPGNASNKTVSFASSDPSIASVNETTGEITGVAKGTAVVTVTAADGGFTDTCAVTIACPHANKTQIAEKVSTCTKQGWDAYSKCNVCGQLFDARNNEISDIPYRTLAAHNYGDPEWIWSNENKNAQAKFVCTACNEVKTVEAEVIRSEKNGIVIYTASVTFNNNIYTFQKQEEGGWIPGDINGDGDVDNKDVVTLFRYASGGQVKVNEFALDVNGDGEVDNKDIVVLFRYVSGSPVTISDKPYTPKMSAVMIAFIPSKSKSDLIV